MAITYLSGQRIQGSSTAVDKHVVKFTVGTGTFTPTESIPNIDVLVVGGGGGGSSGGGGAGGYRTDTLSLTAQAYTFTVGAGGAGSVASTDTGNGANGSTSTFSTISSAGGGGGATIGNYDTPQFGGNDGGSGGGGGSFSTTTTTGGAGNTPSTSPVQGYAGGTNGNFTSSPYPTGGGGGASEVGANGVNSTTSGAGGDGIQNDISGTNTYYAGGGGGGLFVTSGTAGTGGLGGGGNGAIDSATGTAGTVNIGGGGGGTGNTGTGGAGGSGIVILSFDKSYSSSYSISGGTSSSGDGGQTDEKTTVTDVPVGSQFEETNTRKFYLYKLADAVEWDKATFEGQLESTGYNLIQKIAEGASGESWDSRAYGQKLNAVGTTLTFTNVHPNDSAIIGFNDVNTTTPTIGNAGAKLAIRLESTSQFDVYIDGSGTSITGLSLSTSSVYKIEINSGNVKFYIDESGSGSFVEKHEETMTPDSTYYIVGMFYAVMNGGAMETTLSSTTNYWSVRQ